MKSGVWRGLSHWVDFLFYPSYLFTVNTGGGVYDWET